MEAKAGIQSGKSPQFVPTGQGTGMEVNGIDLRERPSNQAVTRIKNVLAETGVLIFRGQGELPESAQLEFTGAFGETTGHPLPGLGGFNPVEGAGEHVFYLTNAVEGQDPKDSAPQERAKNRSHDDPGWKGRPISPGDGELGWHSDLQYMPNPQVYSVLCGIEVPGQGGETEWCNMALAYAALDDETKAEINGLRAVHWLTRRIPAVTHPVVRVHPLSGLRALYVSPGLTRLIEGWDEERAQELLHRLAAHCTREEFCYVHRWQPGDVIMWDNRITMHRRWGFDLSQRRIMRRTQTTGEAVVAA